MLTFIINDIAANFSGALTVLKDCIDYIDANPAIHIEYHLFTSVDIFDFIKNVHIHKIKKKGWISRIIWDNGGLQNLCRRLKLEPDLIISLQNTSTKFIGNNGKNIPQLIYYHQSLPLIPYKWNIFDKQEFVLFLYAHFYSSFVARNSKSSYYVVQLSYIRALFLKKFKRVSREKIFVIRPNNPVIDINDTPEMLLNHARFYFFYPATALKYKNHKIIIQALVLLKQNFSPVLNNIKVVFTLDELEPKLMQLIKEYNLFEVVQLVGQRSYDEVLSYYKSVDALLFPSQIETFGLPLAEASCFGLPIIVADLPYAVEVLEEYNNKILIDPESVYLWADAMKNYHVYKSCIYSSPPHHARIENSWGTFFELANRIIKDTS
jgi:glycosyltransferase involved in cell wall biosynthesis